jgi:hypothetical protein
VEPRVRCFILPYQQPGVCSHIHRHVKFKKLIWFDSFIRLFSASFSTGTKIPWRNLCFFAQHTQKPILAFICLPVRLFMWRHQEGWTDGLICVKFHILYSAKFCCQILTAFNTYLLNVLTYLLYLLTYCNYLLTVLTYLLYLLSVRTFLLTVLTYCTYYTYGTYLLYLFTYCTYLLTVINYLLYLPTYLLNLLTVLTYLITVITYFIYLLTFCTYLLTVLT